MDKWPIWDNWSSKTYASAVDILRLIRWRCWWWWPALFFNWLLIGDVSCKDSKPCLVTYAVATRTRSIYLLSTPLAALLLRGDKVMLQRVANNWSFAHNVCVCRAAARASAHLLAALPALCTQRVLLQLLLPRQWNYIVLLPANKKRYWEDGCIDSSRYSYTTSTLI